MKPDAIVDQIIEACGEFEDEEVLAAAARLVGRMCVVMEVNGTPRDEIEKIVMTNFHAGATYIFDCMAEQGILHEPK